MFHKADEAFIAKYGTQLINHNGTDYSSLVVNYLGKNWIFKSNDNINFLAYEIFISYLGRNIANVTEIKPLSLQELEILNDLKIVGEIDLAKTSSFLTRVAQDYSLSELPLKDIDSAVAGELVLSTLFRRRDTHEYNRAYISYVPIFFDLGVSFEDSDASVFFSKLGKGFAGSWRVRKISQSNEIDLLFRKENWGDNHFILDMERFVSEVQRIVEILKNLNFNTIEIPLLAQKEEKNRIVAMTLKNLNTIDKDVSRMLEVVFSEN